MKKLSRTTQGNFTSKGLLIKKYALPNNKNLFTLRFQGKIYRFKNENELIEFLDKFKKGVSQDE